MKIYGDIFQFMRFLQQFESSSRSPILLYSRNPHPDIIQMWPHCLFPYHLEFNYIGCKNFSIYYTRNTSLPSPPPTCSILQLPVNKTESYGDIFRLLTATFSIEVLVTPFCYRCYVQRGECQIIEGKPECIHSIEGMYDMHGHSKNRER
jgi:hypothetical protein